MSTFSTTPVTVIWDFQYAWIPEGYHLRTLKTNIETALKNCNPDFYIQDQLIAVGTATGAKHQAITMLPDDFTFSPVPQDNPRTPDPQDQTALVLVMELARRLFNEKAKILLISGNTDLIYAIKGYRQIGVFMMVAVPESSFSSFSHCANVTWLWTSEVSDTAAVTMINGGGPIPPLPPTH